MTLRFKLIAIALFGVAAVAGYALWQHHVEQLGAAKVEARDLTIALEAKQRELEQVQRDAKTNEDAVNDLQAERDRLAAAVAATPVPVIRMCVSPAGGGGGLPAAAGAAGGAGQGAPAAGNDAGVPTSVVAGPDIGGALQDIAVVAERLAAQERALLEREAALR